jgi:hypothetical protein
MAAGAGGLDELGGEPLDPPVDGDVIDGDAAFGQQFLHVAVGQAVAQVQRTAREITSRGKRKPANTADMAEDVTGSVCLPAAIDQRNSALASTGLDLTPFAAHH